MAEGYITIGTELVTDKFDKQIMDLEKKIAKKEEKKIEIKAQFDFDTEEADKASEKVEELTKKYNKFKNVQDKIIKGSATGKDVTSFMNYQAAYGSLEDLGSELEKASTKEDRLLEKVIKTGRQWENVNTEVQDYKTKIETLKLQKHQSEIEKVQQGFKNVGNSIQDAVTKIGKLTLGIFGVRSAYMALRSASSSLAQYDEQYAANLEYIRFVLTQAIAPILRGIIQLAMQLLQLINSIVNSLFGINLFSSGSAENFRKMKAGASGVSKAVKEIKKQLTGFDEANILSDQSDTGTSAGAGGVKMPDMDLSQLQGERPKWMQWIIDNGPTLLKILGAIFTFLSLRKIGEFLGQTLGLGKALSKVKDIVIGVFKVISANKGVFAGIVLAALGIVDALDGIVKYIQDPSWENFGQIIRGIGIAIAGFGLIVGSIPAIVIGAVTAIVGHVIKHWDEIKAVLDTVGAWIYDHVIKPVGDFFTKLWDNTTRGLKETWNKIADFLKPIQNWIKDNVTTPISDLFTGLWDGVKKIFQSTWDFILSGFSEGGKFFNGIKEGIASIFKTMVNAIISGINTVISVPFNVVNGLLNKIKGATIPVINVQPFMGLWNWNPLPVPQIPKLATGGIINMPNKGTMLSGMAIGGEAGREGVVPLTDQQAMAELGREIGKNVLVNLTNITTMNGRVLQREVKQITNSQEFAYNA